MNLIRWSSMVVFGMVVLGGGVQANAHPGHGHPNMQEGISHYVLNPMHGLPWVIGIGLLLVIVLLARGMTQSIQHRVSPGNRRDSH